MVVGGDGGATGGGVSGGAGMRGVAKCTRAFSVVSPASARVDSKNEFARSSA